SGPGEPDDAELGADADEQELDELDEYLIVLNEPEEKIAASLARDMHTRYAWQVPKDIPYSRTSDKVREMLWREFAPLLRSKIETLKCGRPAAGESREGLLLDEFDHYDLWLTDRRLRQRGIPDAERLALLANAYKVSTAKAERVRDSIRGKMLAALN